MGNLIEGLQKEQIRVREILGHYEEIGIPGMFGASLIKHELQKAEQAISNGDVVKMIDAYNGLKLVEG